MRCEGNPAMHSPPRRNVQSHAKECVPQIDFPGVHCSRRSLSTEKSLCAPTHSLGKFGLCAHGEVYAGGCSSKWRKGTEGSAGCHKISALTKMVGAAG